MNSAYRDVYDFHNRFAIPRGRTPAIFPRSAEDDPTEVTMRERLGHLAEELAEIIDAYTAGADIDVIDGLIDLVYVAYGTAIVMGVTPPQWEEAWRRVQVANMAKVQSGAPGKQGIRKPDGWRPPDLAPVFDQLTSWANEVS